jgi:transcriptional regulator with XRE-family HTH domain
VSEPTQFPERVLDVDLRTNGREIRKRRKLLGLTLEQFAKRSGVSKTVLCEAEKGQPKSPTTLKKIANALGTTIDIITLCEPKALPESDVVVANLPVPIRSRSNEDSSTPAATTNDDVRVQVEFELSGSMVNVETIGKILKAAQINKVPCIVRIFPGNSVHVILDMDNEDAKRVLNAFLEGKLDDFGVEDVTIAPDAMGIQLSQPTSSGNSDDTFHGAKWTNGSRKRPRSLRPFWKWFFLFILVIVIASGLTYWLTTKWIAIQRRAMRLSRVANAKVDANWPPSNLVLSGDETIVDDEGRVRHRFVIILRRTPNDSDPQGHYYDGTLLPIGLPEPDPRLVTGWLDTAADNLDSDGLHLRAEYSNAHLEWPDLTIPLDDKHEEREKFEFDIMINRAERTFSGKGVKRRITSPDEEQETRLRGKINF